MIHKKYVDVLSSSKLQMANTARANQTDLEALTPAPYKRTVLETKILTAVELPLLTKSLNETRMNSKDVTEYQDYIKGRKCK